MSAATSALALCVRTAVPVKRDVVKDGNVERPKSVPKLDEASPMRARAACDAGVKRFAHPLDESAPPALPVGDKLSGHAAAP